MEATYKISEEDYVRAMKLSSKISPRIKAIYAVAVLALVFVAAFGSTAVIGGVAGGLIGGGAVAVLARLLVNNFLARRHYKKYKAIHEPINIRLQEEGIELSTSDGRVLVRWEKIVKWRQNEAYFLVYPMPRLYHIIPKSISDSGFDLSALVTALRDKVGKET